jgi:hypothetical protein
MLDTDMCMVYKDSKDYSDCMEDMGSSGGTGGSHGTCMELLDTATELNEITQGRQENCCGWVFASKIFDATGITEMNFCGLDMEDNGEDIARRNQCCKFEEDDSYGDCDSP